jgi:succinate dehydrogenase/fumarate reductase cytochrome b subunit
LDAFILHWQWFGTSLLYLAGVNQTKGLMEVCLFVIVFFVVVDIVMHIIIGILSIISGILKEISQVK